MHLKINFAVRWNVLYVIQVLLIDSVDEFLYNT